MFVFSMLKKRNKIHNKEIRVDSVLCNGKTISYEYIISENLKDFFNMDNKMQLNYSMDISKVPYEVAIIPFLAGIAPMIFLEDITVYVDKIDKNFYESLDNLREAYKKMLPKGSWKGKIVAKNVIDLSKNYVKGKCSMFYSGGLDSASTFASVCKNKPLLLTIWGSDILQSNEKGWLVAKEMTQRLANHFNLNDFYVNSNFRFYLNENALTTKYRNLLPTGWWYDVQHGPALLGHVAPLAYLNKLEKHYIPASHNINTRSDVVCASLPSIDESIKFCGCNVIHEGFDLNRVQKVENVSKFLKKNKYDLKLRVCCVERDDELNCCGCEKCYRTILEILSCKEDPKKYGFDISKKKIKGIKNFLDSIEIQDVDVAIWKETQDKFLEDKKYFEKDNSINWILDYDFDKITIKDYSKEIWDKNGNKITIVK